MADNGTETTVETVDVEVTDEMEEEISSMGKGDEGATE